MSFLPAQLEPYASLIILLILFIDGAIFGIAIKKGFTAIILIIVGILLASYAGLNIPFINLAEITNAVSSFLVSEIGKIGPIFISFPILWIIGFLLGVWKG
jgi:hypothetical protein